MTHATSEVNSLYDHATEQTEANELIYATSIDNFLVYNVSSFNTICDSWQ